MATPLSNDPNPMVGRVARLDTQTAIETLDMEEAGDAARILSALPPARANRILSEMSEESRDRIMEAAPPGTDWTDSLR